MYIWLAIDLDDQLSALRNAAQRVTDNLCAYNPALTLPLHTSLRISFFVDDAAFDRVVTRIEHYFRTLHPFTLAPQQIEQHGGIVWLTIKPDADLSRIHGDLVNLLQNEFSVPAHPFDDNFRYHASLFLHPDEAMAATAYSALQHESFPPALLASKLIVGISDTGKAGTYRVLREYALTE